MDRAVIYARYSSSRQREESIEGQVRECMDFAKRSGIKVLNVYADRALTGKTDARPQFLKMIADSAKNKFDIVLVYQLDRFARNRFDSATYKAKLKKNGVRVVSARENISGDASGIILESVLEGMAEYYSVELAQKVRRGMTDSAMACKALGKLPFGFTKDANNRVIVDEDAAPLVRLIYDMYVSGEKIVDILRTANEKSYLTAYGNKFTRTSLQKIICNEFHTGTYKWGDIVVKDAFPAIITPEVFELACARRARQAYKGKGNNVTLKSNKFILTTKLFCANCGGNMVGISGTSKSGKPYYYYTCYTHHKDKKACLMPNIRQDVLEKAILDTAVQLLSSPQNLQAIASALTESAKGQNVELKLLENMRRNCQGKLDNCLKLVDKGLISDALMEHITEHELSLRKIKADIEKIKVAERNADDNRERIIYFLENILKGNENERRNRIVSTLIQDVVLEYDRQNGFFATITFNCNEHQNRSTSGLTGIAPEKMSLVILPIKNTNISVSVGTNTFSAKFPIPA